MPATGPALANTSAKRTGKPKDSNKGLSPRLAQNKNATVLNPRPAVTAWTWPNCWTNAPTNSKKLCPSALTPKITLSWPAAINRAEAVMNPEMTGWLRKLAKKPKRNKPMTSNMAPDRNAKVMATPQYEGEPTTARSPTAVAVMSDTTATGPTANTRLVPKIAYSNKGAMLAYKPTSGGKPANEAYAKLWGMSMMVTISAATRSLISVSRS